MNNRIKELILQSVNFRLDPDSNCHEAQVCPEDLEYLAELIGKEVLTLQNRHGNIKPRVIKQFFGVDE